MNPTRFALARALLGAAFALLGLLIALQLAFRIAPLNQKIFGFAFAAVLIGLGAVRIRQYLSVRKRLP